MSFHERRRRSAPALSVVLAAVCLIAAPLAEAVPIISSANVWRADRTPNPIGFIPSALVPWVSVTTTAGGEPLASVTASISGTTYDLARISGGVLAGLYFAQLPYDAALSDPWTITATDTGGNSAQSIRPAFVPVDAMPFLDSIDFTGTGNDITVNWTVSAAADLRLTEQNVSIWDLSSFAGPTTVQFFPLADRNQRSLDLSTLGLLEGVSYAVEINSVARNGTTGFIDAFSGNWLNGWMVTEGEVQLPTSVPEPATFSLLLAGLAGLGLRRRRRVTT
jgi:hypothetical protein